MAWIVKREYTGRVMAGACFLGMAISPCFGQSLGETARQEQARKQSQPAAREHVYTNEDFRRPQILLPEDQARFKTSRTESTAPSVATQVPPAPPKSDEIPLGDVARYYRLLKQFREMQAQGMLPGLDGGPLLARPAAPLSRPKIEPAAGNTPIAPLASPAVGSIPPPPGNDGPLGDVARYYQRLKEAREAQSKAAAASESHVPLMPSPLPGAPPAAVASPGNHPPSSGVTRSPRGRELKPPRRVRVMRGDSLWKLARRYLGRGTDWRRLAALNPQVVDSRRLQVGDLIRLPGLSSLPGVARTIRVQKGDTLWKIAATELGSGLAWTCIARANRDLADANLILPEHVLNLPSACHMPPRP